MEPIHDLKESPAVRENILVTGGTGFLGLHTIVSLIAANYDVTVIDNLCNSSAERLTRIPRITSCDPSRIRFFRVDLRDAAALESVFRDSPRFTACVHFAGLKVLSESISHPLAYYENNLTGTVHLLKMVDKYRCGAVVFSSSATVYGAQSDCPIRESATVGQGITNPYGYTKYMIEEVLRDFHRAKVLEGVPCNVVILRYFNPVGAHPSGWIGEDPNGLANNLMPHIVGVAVGKKQKLTICGDDFPTKDGTGVRDFIHVMDLAEGHVAALKRIERNAHSGQSEISTYNLGTGAGYSVLELVQAMRRASGHPLPCEVGPRRPGDIATSFADVSKAKKELDWSATRGIDEICRDVWNWLSLNPNGYD